MKNVHELCIVIRNPLLLNYWKWIILSQRILVFFAIEILKFKRGFASTLCKEMISQNRQNSYELRNNAHFNLPLVKSVHNSLESLSYLSPKICGILSV